MEAYVNKGPSLFWNALMYKMDPCKKQGPISYSGESGLGKFKQYTMWSVWTTDSRKGAPFHPISFVL